MAMIPYSQEMWLSEHCLFKKILSESKDHGIHDNLKMPPNHQPVIKSSVLMDHLLGVIKQV